MIMVDPDPGWFKIFKAPCFKLEEEEKGNIEYIEKIIFKDNSDIQLYMVMKVSESTQSCVQEVF